TPQRKQKASSPAAALRSTLDSGRSALLFVKRRPSRGDLRPTAHGRSGEGAMLLSSLIARQREQPDREIMLMPQTFVWTPLPERRGFSFLDAVFGTADLPGD